MRKEVKSKVKKKGKFNTKILALYIAVFVVVLITSGVFAEQVGLSKSAQKVVDDIMKNKGVNPEDVQSVEEVTFDQLPSQIDVDNIDDTNLAVYEVRPIEGNSFFVVTASDKNVKKTQTVSGEMRYVMDFGYNGIMENEGFLRTSVDVETSYHKGYVMMREGSITGLSTNLESVSGKGIIYVTLYKNGEEIGFRNSFVVEDEVGKVMKDYDLQSPGVVSYEPGDVISMYVESEGDVVWKDVITRVEITEK